MALCKAGALAVMQGYWERRNARNLDDNPHSAAFFQQVCVGDTDESCEREWWPHVDYFFNNCLHLYPGMASAPGHMTEASLGETYQGMHVGTWDVASSGSVKPADDAASRASTECPELAT